ncbi:MAG: hypothetical protein IJP82_08100 [Bacteroidaceae bacterium]|nr:hypothetical protein [Bacteroidaceae bacterium]
MNTELIQKVREYVEEYVGEFHTSCIAKLQAINSKDLLTRKNPYMYRAKNIVTTGGMVESLAAAYMSSTEESILGNWLEGLEKFVSEEVYGGYKFAAIGVDLEFDKEEMHYFVSVKSGPSWSNNQSKGKLKRDFIQAVKIFNTSRKTVPTMCTEGCCYGNDNRMFKVRNN